MLVKLFRFHFCILLFLFSTAVNAQNTSPYQAFTFNLYRGSHLFPTMTDYNKPSLNGFELNYSRSINQQRQKWSKSLNAKEISFSFIHMNLDNLPGFRDSIKGSVGQSYGLSTFLRFELLKISRFSLCFAPGVGLAYLPKTYFEDKNNRYISNRLNHQLHANLQLSVELMPSINLEAGTNFLHFSNGAWKVPNEGLNILNYSVGLRYDLNTKTASAETKPVFEHKKKSSFELVAGIGRRGVFQQEHLGIMKSAIYLGYNKRLNDVMDIKLGNDWVYVDVPYRKGSPYDTHQYLGSSAVHWRTGISTGIDLKMNRFILTAKYGQYLYFKNLYNVKGYWDLGMKCFITPNIGLQYNLHVHRLSADFIDYGLVFKI